MPSTELEQSTIDTVKATAPLVAENATKITSLFYQILFDEHPEQKSVFNMSHHRKGNGGMTSSQGRALAQAVIAYAANCDNLGALGDAVELITEKHVSLHIQPEQYLIVGKCLLKAIKEILGDIATEEILNEWKTAIFFLAGILIEVEKKKYEAQIVQKGGWVGFKELTVTKKEKESKNVTSFYFGHTDGTKIPDNFKPGQYIAIKVPSSAFGGEYDHDMCRNYSVSCAPGQGYLRCSIGRSIDKSDPDKIHHGVVSNYMHDQISQGEKVLVTMPRGHFTLKDHKLRPLVMTAAGIGMTPILSMIDFLTDPCNKNPKQKIICIQVERSPEEHAMKYHIDHLVGEKLVDAAHVFYTRCSGKNVQLKNTTIYSGRLSIDTFKSILKDILDDAEFYFCGPEGFMTDFEKMLDLLSIDKSRRHSERFGPAT